MTDSLSMLVIYEVGLLVVVASLSSEFFKRIHLPGLIGPVLVGLVIGGPGGLGLVTNLTVVEILGVLGSVLILFVVGLEFEASAFWKLGRTAFLLTTGGVVVSLIAGYAIGTLLGWSSVAAFLLGVVMAPSGTSVVASILNAEGKVESKTGQMLLTACIVDDVEGILLLTVALAMVSQKTFSTYESLRVALVAVVFILATIYIGGKVFPLFISRLARALSDEVFFSLFLGAGLILAYVATRIGLAAITGAFILGAVIPYSKIGEKISNRLHFMKELFAAVFFATIGLSIDPSDILRFFPMALVVCATGIVSRLIGGTMGGKAARLSGKHLMTSTIGLAIRAEMSLIIAREGVAIGVIGNDFLSVAATAVILTMVFITPIYSRLVRNI